MAIQAGKFPTIMNHRGRHHTSQERLVTLNKISPGGNLNARENHQYEELIIDFSLVHQWLALFLTREELYLTNHSWLREFLVYDALPPQGILITFWLSSPAYMMSQPGYYLPESPPIP
jgi:hypothetical protein